MQNNMADSAKAKEKIKFEELYSRISNPRWFYSTRNKCRQLRAVLSTKLALQLDRSRRSLCEKKFVKDNHRRNSLPTP